MTDNAELVHITHVGILFGALVELMPEDQEVALFYGGVDVTALMPFFDSRVRYNIERMAVTAAMKKRADKAEFDKWSDAK